MVFGAGWLPCLSRRIFFLAPKTTALCRGTLCVIALLHSTNHSKGVIHQPGEAVALNI
jgi:hypothetical protein